MHEDVDWNLLAKHLAGECTDEESARLESWLSAAPERERLVAELAEIWTAARPDPARHDVDALWARLQEHVQRPAHAGAESQSVDPSETVPTAPPSAHRSPLRRLSADRMPAPRRAGTAQRPIYAATLIVVLAACVTLIALWSRETGRVGSGDEHKTFITKRGQRATIRLTDGTIVHLNAASTLAVSPAFGEEARSVRLEGEAYFEVAPDSNRSFSVHAGPAIAQVLGTSFNVTAYPDENRVRVVVAEGAVALQEAGTDPALAPVRTVLVAQQMGELDGTGRLVRADTRVERHLDWMGGYLNFRDAAFPEVVLRLARWYDVDVVIDEAHVPAGHLNARFTEHQALDDVLRVIATAFDLEFELTSTQVRFFPAKTSPDAARPGVLR